MDKLLFSSVLFIIIIFNSNAFNIKTINNNYETKLKSPEINDLNQMRVNDAISRLAFLYLNNLGTSYGNIVYSPFSLQLLLSMIYLGACNASKKELKSILGYEQINLTDEQLYDSLKKLLNKNANKTFINDNYDLDIASVMLIHKDFNTLSSFRNNLTNYFNTDITNIDFQSNPKFVLHQINNWVNWKTKGKITSILEEPLNTDTKLFIINSIYFNGTWKYKFDKQLTMDLTFYVDGKTESAKLVQFMSQKLIIPYATIPEMSMKVIQLPYSTNDDVSMMILLPYERDGVPRLMRSLTSSSLHSIFPKLKKEEVMLHLPIFHLEETYDLRLVLERLGISKIFDESKADLCDIDGIGNLYVSKALHKAVIEVNEEGTQASGISAAATSVRTSLPGHEYFNADHPFIFLLRQGSSILFIGRVSNP